MELREKIALIVPTPSMTPEEIADAILSLPELKEALEARAQHRAWAGDFSKRLGHSISTGTRE
jgi:hypothetical protein